MNTEAVKKDLKYRIIEQVAPDLEKIETALLKGLDPNIDLIRQIASHLLFSGGKRLRPLLAVHSAGLSDFSDEFIFEFSTIFEFLHAATLLHDDVVDGADLRRGEKAAHTRWSAPKVVLTGDFLLAKGLEIAAKAGSPRIISVIANITREMAQGEIDQLDQAGRTDLNKNQYLEIIRRKTAVLIQGACKSGAIISGADREKQAALDAYGFHLGMAFQMADDLLDYTATAGDLGKNPGADIREGKLTLPLIHALEHASDQDRKWISELIEKRAPSPEQFEMLLDKLNRYQGIIYTRNRAREHVEKSRQSLEIFHDCRSKEILGLIAEYSIARKV